MASHGFPWAPEHRWRWHPAKTTTASNTSCLKGYLGVQFQFIKRIYIYRYTIGCYKFFPNLWPYFSFFTIWLYIYVMVSRKSWKNTFWVEIHQGFRQISQPILTSGGWGWETTLKITGGYSESSLRDMGYLTNDISLVFDEETLGR
jgi:hypothetical protein